MLNVWKSWNLRSATTAVNSSAPRYYQCNIYDKQSKEGKHADEERSRAKAKHALDKYMFYFERFMDHDRGMRLTVTEEQDYPCSFLNHSCQAHKLTFAFCDFLIHFGSSGGPRLWQDIEGKVQRLHDEHGFAIIELQFLYDALRQVRACRRVLKWTYVYGYYLDDCSAAHLIKSCKPQPNWCTTKIKKMIRIYIYIYYIYVNIIIYCRIVSVLILQEFCHGGLWLFAHSTSDVIPARIVSSAHFEEKNLFEYLQKNLEEKTDCLHEMLEKDLDKSFFDQENQLTNGSEEAHQKFMTFRSHATNFTNVTQKFLTQILTDLGSETGLGQKCSQSSAWTRAVAPLRCPVMQWSVMDPASLWWLDRRSLSCQNETGFEGKIWKDCLRES